ncbi:MAG: phosphatase PAP2 family protein [Alphaproteobacteria bacterium]|nr:phosphatase PAP2 family protein [Alphaproteobacteria bacterium]
MPRLGGPFQRRSTAMNLLKRLVRSDASNTGAEVRVLLSLLFIAGVALAFGKLTSEVFEGDTRAFDRTVLLAFRHADNLSVPVGPAWLEGAFRDVTSFGSTAVLTLIVVAVAGYLLIERKRAMAVLVVASVAGGGLLNTLMKEAFGRQRPDIVPHLMTEASLSYPSAHAMVSAVTYLTIGILLARNEQHGATRAYVFGVAVAITLLVGGSRVYLGVHWPTDVLAGWMAGAVWALGCWLVAGRLQRRGKA